jgi:hypothetical protein
LLTGPDAFAGTAPDKNGTITRFSLRPLVPFTVTKLVTNPEISKVVAARDVELPFLRSVLSSSYLPHPRSRRPRTCKPGQSKRTSAQRVPTTFAILQERPNGTERTFSNSRKKPCLTRTPRRDSENSPEKEGGIVIQLFTALSDNCPPKRRDRLARYGVGLLNLPRRVWRSDGP